MSAFKMSDAEIKNILTSANQARLDATGGIDFSKPELKPGAQLMAIKNVKATKFSKGDETTIKIVMTCNLADERNTNFRDIPWTLTVQGEYEEIGKSILIEFLDRSFKYTLKACKDETDLVAQISKFKGKAFQAALREREYLAKSKEEGGGQGLKIASQVEIWYTGADGDEFNVDPTKLKKELSDKDKKRWQEYLALNTSSNPGTSAFSSDEEPARVPQDDLPF